MSSPQDKEETRPEEQNRPEDRLYDVKPAGATASGAPVMAGRRSLPSARGHTDHRAHRGKFLPTLFDRLCDNEPLKKTEGPTSIAVSRGQLKDIIRRDLVYLLNTTNVGDQIDAVLHPELPSSTINFGVPAFAGNYLSDRKWNDIEKILRRAILHFEPRLIAESVKIKPLLKGEARDNYNVLLFEIQALLHMEPYPIEFLVQSAVDLETNRLTIEPLS